MMEVFFNGRGEWFIEDSNGEINPAIRNEYIDSKGFDSFFNGITTHMFCREYVGIFRLTYEDEEIFKHIEDFNLVKKSVKKLLPCSHPVSVFSKIVEKGLVSEENVGRCYFEIQRSEILNNKMVDTNYILEPAKPAEPSKAETITETERSTMLKLIIGMAMDSYEYNPNSTRNSATGDKNGISAKLQLHGISVNDDTIRKYLTEAKKLLSSQEK